MKYASGKGPFIAYFQFSSAQAGMPAQTRETLRYWFDCLHVYYALPLLPFDVALILFLVDFTYFGN